MALRAYACNSRMIWIVYANGLDQKRLDCLLEYLFRNLPCVAEEVYKSVLGRQIPRDQLIKMLFPIEASRAGRLDVLWEIAGYVDMPTVVVALSVSTGNSRETWIQWLDTVTTNAMGAPAGRVHLFVAIALFNAVFSSEDDLRAVCQHCKEVISVNLFVAVVAAFLERKVVSVHANGPAANIRAFLQVMDVRNGWHAEDFRSAMLAAGRSGDWNSFTALGAHSGYREDKGISESMRRRLKRAGLSAGIKTLESPRPHGP